MPSAPANPVTDAVRAFLSSRPSKSLSAVHYNSLTRYYYAGKVITRFTSGDPAAHYDKVVAALLKLVPTATQANLLWMAVARYYTYTQATAGDQPIRPDRPKEGGRLPPLPKPRPPVPGVKYIP